MIFQNFQETRKGTWHHKSLGEHREIRKIKIHMWTVLLLIFLQAFFLPLKRWKKMRCKCLYKMKCQLYTVLHLALLVKMKNIIPNKITNGRIWKIDITKSCLAIENNQLKCGEKKLKSLKSLLFSRCADDDEKHFN